MGRHIVVSFDSTAEAEAFIAAMKVAGSVFYQGADSHFVNINPETAKVAGVFGKADSFCECPYLDENKKPVDFQYVRGSTFGRFVHVTCKKPQGGHYQTALKNLLHPPGVEYKYNNCGISIREGESRWPVPKADKPT